MDRHEGRLTLFLILFTLIGIVFVWSASIGIASQNLGDPYYYVKRQLLYGFAIGWIAFLILRQIRPSLFFRFSFLILLANIAFVVAALFGGGSVRRWLTVGGISVQPGEFVKFSVALFLSSLFARKVGSRELVIGLGLVGICGVLFYLQPAMSNFLIVFAVALACMILGNVRWRTLLLLGLIALPVIALMLISAQYRVGRFQAFLNQGASYHLSQAKLAIGSGGLWGKGLGKGKSKLSYLPEAVNDSIFAVIAEEVGFVGSAGLLALYVYLAVWLLAVSREHGGPEGMYLGALATWIMVQTVVHVGSNVGLIPPTGVTLPFISYGSSSVVSLFAAFGVAASLMRKKHLIG